MKGRETVQALLDGKFIVHIYNSKQAWRLEDDGLYFHNPKVNAWFRAPNDATFHLLMTANFTECEKTEILLNARIIRTIEDFIKSKMSYPTIRCNNCMELFEDDNDLIIVKDDGEYFPACPNCKTDEYLMDLE